MRSTTPRRLLVMLDKAFSALPASAQVGRSSLQLGTHQSHPRSAVRHSVRATQCAIRAFGSTQLPLSNQAPLSGQSTSAACATCSSSSSSSSANLGQAVLHQQRQTAVWDDFDVPNEKRFQTAVSQQPVHMFQHLRTFSAAAQPQHESAEQAGHSSNGHSSSGHRIRVTTVTVPEMPPTRQSHQLVRCSQGEISPEELTEKMAASEKQQSQRLQQQQQPQQQPQQQSRRPHDNLVSQHQDCPTARQSFSQQQQQQPLSAPWSPVQLSGRALQQQQQQSQQLPIQQALAPVSAGLVQTARTPVATPAALEAAQPAATDEFTPVQDSCTGTTFFMKGFSERQRVVPEDVLVVDSPEAAQAVVSYIHEVAHNGAGRHWTDDSGRRRTEPDIYFACDTEVADIDVKTQSPVGHGVVICFSLYAGPWMDFGAAVTSTGQPVVAAAAVKKNRIWVDLTAGWHERRQQQLMAIAQQQAADAQRAAVAKAGASQCQQLTGDAELEHASASDEQAGTAAAGRFGSHRRRSQLAARQMMSDAEEPPLQQESSAEILPPPPAAAAGGGGGSRRRRKAGKTAARGDVETAANISNSSGDSGMTSCCAAVGMTVLETLQQHSELSAMNSHLYHNGSSSSSSSGVSYGCASAAAAAATEVTCLNRTESSTSAAFPLFAASAAVVPGASVYGGTIPAPTLDDVVLDDRSRGILEAFRPFFRDQGIKKVWHNYGFDRHVLERLYTELDARTPPHSTHQAPAATLATGVCQRFKIQGFGGDTLHMSRLWDASRLKNKNATGGYSLEGLSGDRNLSLELEKDLGAAAALPKRSMQDRFGMFRAKTDNTPVKVAQIPPMHVLQTDDTHRAEWIDYSALDAKATWNVHRALKCELQKKEAFMDQYLCDKLAAGAAATHSQRMQWAQETLRRSEAAQQQDKVKQTKPAAGSGGKGGLKRVAAGPLRSTLPAAAPPARPKPRRASSISQPPVEQQQQQTSQAAGRQVVAATAAVVAVEPFLPSSSSNGASSSESVPVQPSSSVSYTLWDVYCDYWQPFGEVLTDMEAEGVRVNRAHLQEQELLAVKDQQAAERHFRDWVKRYVPGAEHMNVNSGTQIRQLLFPDSCAAPTKTFKALNPEYDLDPRPKGVRRHIDFTLHGLWGPGRLSELDVEAVTDKGMAAVSGAVLWGLVGKPGAAAKALAELEAEQQEQAAGAAQHGDHSSSSSSNDDRHAIPLHGGDDDLDFPGLCDEDLNLDASAAAAVSGGNGVVVVPTADGADEDPEKQAALEQMAKKWKLGKMFGAMAKGKGEAGVREGVEACLALEKLIEVSTIDKLLSSFIQPLQSDNISTSALVPLPQDKVSSDLLAAADGSDSGCSSRVLECHRVHCSLNLNTETGRLSARRPNLQNQPALEKDRYKVRKAFCAAPGKTLVVADYGQLELRLLAHMTDCKSMIRAFELGGDFHSRTALGMYDYIKDDIAAGGCLLEVGDWQGEGDPPQLLKDKYGSERRKAKILNFSIAYGKTAHGLSKDFGVSLAEAEATVERWYADRPEVRRWQEMTKQYAAKYGWVNTMIGRRRGLPDIHRPQKWVVSAAQRAAINTPIQGSAADVASAAMLAIVKDEWLRDNGWKLLLQVHDEVMLEGPRESAQEARARVVAAMENPWKNLIGFEGQPLRVELAVDANVADTWYEAK